jgi:hypothetical protein
VREQIEMALCHCCLDLLQVGQLVAAAVALVTNRCLGSSARHDKSVHDRRMVDRAELTTCVLNRAISACSGVTTGTAALPCGCTANSPLVSVRTKVAWVRFGHPQRRGHCRRDAPGLDLPARSSG